MRTIKFRMWNNVKDSPNKSRYFYEVHEVMECLKQQMLFNKIPSSGLAYDHISNGNSFEQFTGLTDKNGKDIYEGDILKWISTTGINEGIEFRNQVYFLSYRFRIKGTKNGKTFHSDFNPNQIFNHSCEIIGNIHENPELLTK